MAFLTISNYTILSDFCVLQQSKSLLDDETSNNNLKNSNKLKSDYNEKDNYENYKVINDNNNNRNRKINKNKNSNNSNNNYLSKYSDDRDDNNHNDVDNEIRNDVNNCIEDYNGLIKIGAKCLRLSKLNNTDNNNCNNNNNMHNTTNSNNNCNFSFVHSSQFFKVFFYKFMNCVLNMLKFYSFRTDRRCKSLRLIRILNSNSSLITTIETTIETKFRKSPLTTTIRTKTTNLNKLILHRNYLKIFLISCILLSCIGITECRPNSSSSSTTSNEGGGSSNVDGGGQNNGNVKVEQRSLGSDNSNSKGPADSYVNFDSTKSASLTSDKQDNTERIPHDDFITADVTHESVSEKETKGFPVFQVEFQKVKTPFIISVWILSASIAKIGFHITPKLHKIFPESCLLIVVGIIIGLILFFGTKLIISPLTPTTFFFYILPPIILDAGYFMPNRLFFDNLGTILLFAVIGTVFNTVTIGASIWACGLTGMFGNGPPPLLDSFLFSSIISAVDPVAVLAVFEEIHVNEILYIVVFGESLLNDAVTVVLYHMMEAYNEIGINNLKAGDIASGFASFLVVAIGGTTVGVIWGLLTGLITRFTDHVRVIEPIFIFIMAYLAYLTAEVFHMSGILAITFCGITMKNYVEANISQKSHTTVKYALKMLSSSSETIIFIFLGVATVNHHHVWNTVFVIMTIIFCSIFRILGVILLSALANHFRLHKLSKVDQFVMSYGGLRGAVAFALVLLVDDHVAHKEMFVTTTIAVIYFTVFVQGITIKPLVKYLNVKRASKKKPTMNERIHERFMDHLMAGVEDIVGKTGNYNLRDKFKRFDNRFIRPLLIRDLQGAEPKILETYSKLTMKDAMEVIRRNPSTIGQMSGTESMSALFRNYTNNYLGGRCAASFLNTCPSLTNLETCSRNLDMHELDYNPSKKDLTDAKIHHLLAQELKPYRKHRRLSYSRHTVDDRDLSTQVNYKMHMNIRRIINDRKHHKRSKRGGNKQEGIKQNHVSFHDFQENGTNKQLTNDYINDVLNESVEEECLKPSQSGASGGGGVGVTTNDDWDDGLTFTAKSSPDADRANNNSLIAHITSLPGFDTSKARIVKHYTTSKGNNPEKFNSPEDIGPTAAELILPWRRDRSYHNFGEATAIPEEDRNTSRDSDGERNTATPTAIESQLPWKRNEDENEDDGPVKQNEFPAWASNKEYLAYNSPSATFLGGLSKPKQAKSVIGLFRRESSGSGSVIGTPAAAGSGGVSDGLIGSDPSFVTTTTSGVSSSIPPPPLFTSNNSNSGNIVGSSQYNRGGGGGHDRRSASISGFGLNEGHSGPFPITASHRRNTRRGSMLELSGNIIPEENNGYDNNHHGHSYRHHHYHSKSLCENDDEWSATSTATAANSLKSNTPTTASLNITTFSNSPSGKLNRGSSIGGGGGGGGDAASANSGGGDVHEPLLPKLTTTPKPQIRKGMLMKQSPVTTALLSSSNTSDTEDNDDGIGDRENDYGEYDEDDDENDYDEEEDLDVYDDDKIVNTSVPRIQRRSGGLDRNQRT